MRAAGHFQNYQGGIFSGCTSNEADHAVTVVGYGHDNATGVTDDDVVGFTSYGAHGAQGGH